MTFAQSSQTLDYRVQALIADPEIAVKLWRAIAPACLLLVKRDCAVTSEFANGDIDRWSVNPRNYAASIVSFTMFLM